MTPRIFVIGIVALAAVSMTPVTTATNATGCGIAPAGDPVLAQLDRTQSRGAAKICALYMNSAEWR